MWLPICRVSSLFLGHNFHFDNAMTNISPAGLLKKTISIIIPTYNGAHKLPYLLEALSQQTLKPDQILVVVDGSSDWTASVLQSFRQRMPALESIFIENSGRSVVRNTGAQQATGDILLFFDDDMVPEADCVQKHCQHHMQEDASFLTGMAIDCFTETDIQRYKTSLALKWARQISGNGKILLGKENLYLTAAHFSTHRSTFEQLGGFDEKLRDAEDGDLAHRAHKKGYRLFFDHSLMANHRDQIKGISYIRRLREYRQAHIMLYASKPQIYNDVKKSYQYRPGFLKRLVYRFFATERWIRWLDHDNGKWLLPRSIRYRIYSLIITSNTEVYPSRVILP